MPQPPPPLQHLRLMREPPAAMTDSAISVLPSAAGRLPTLERLYLYVHHCEPPQLQRLTAPPVLVEIRLSEYADTASGSTQNGLRKRTRRMLPSGALSSTAKIWVSAG